MRARPLPPLLLLTTAWLAAWAAACGDTDALDPFVPDTTPAPTFRPLPDVSPTGADAASGEDASASLGDTPGADDSDSDSGDSSDSGEGGDGVTTPADTSGAADDATEDADMDADADADTDPPDAPITPGPVALGARISRVDVYQTVASPWMLGGQAVVSDPPLVAGRDAVMRVFITPDPGFSAQPLTARVVVRSAGGSRAFVDTRTISAASVEAQVYSTLNVRIPGDALTVDASASVSLLAALDAPGESPADGATHPAVWPQVGATATLGARADTGPLKITLVPFRYDKDGSGRLPDLSPAQLSTYEGLLRALYPHAQVQLTVHAPYPWGSSVSFGSFNQALVQLREDEAAPDDVYYYGLIQPAETFSAYCGGSCTTGQSYTVSDGAAGTYRVGTGVGFSGEDSAWTMAHELGHMYGRGHAPCGVSWWSDDDAYPHSGGVIGAWGWDARAGAFKAPADWTDVMGYCDDLWMSDYTYAGLYERAVSVRADWGQLSPWPTPRAYRFLTLDAQGQATWGAPARLRAAYTGRWLQVTTRDADLAARQTLAVPVIEADHAGGRDLLIPADLLAAPAVWLEVPGAAAPIPITP